MDSAASSLTPEPVIRKVLEFYRGYRANVGRGAYSWALEATEEYESARREVARFIKARRVSEIIFTKNTTEGINLVASGLKWRRGEKIVSTILEHHSNFLPWLRASRKFGLKLEIVRPDATGRFELADFERAVDERTRLVAVSHASNVLGCVLPVEEIAEIAHEKGSRVLVDGAQSVPHLPTDVSKMGCDFLAFSGHKMLAPTGIGVLYVRAEVLNELEPFAVGGGTIDDVSTSGFVLTDPPARFEGGTPPIAQAIGLGEAVRYLRRCGMRRVAAHERALTERMLSGLEQIEGVEVYGPPACENRLGIVSFNLKNLDPDDVAQMLERDAKIMVRSGCHCAIPLHAELLKKPQGSVRSSLYIYNTRDEIETFVEAVRSIAERFL